MDHFTCEEFSNMLGKTTVEILSPITQSIRQGLFGDFNPQHIRMEDKQIQRDLLQPSELRRLGQKYGIIILRGNPVYFERIIYNQDLFFLEKARLDPNYPEMLKTKKNLQINNNEAKRIIPDLYSAIQKSKDYYYKLDLFPLFVKHKLLGFNKEYSFSSDESLIEWVRENLAFKETLKSD